MSHRIRHLQRHHTWNAASRIPPYTRASSVLSQEPCRRANDGTLGAPEGTAASAELCQPAPFLPEPPNSVSWQTIRGGMDPAEPNLSYLAGDHTDGPAWASWTHRQLGVMMHRMLPINRAYCRAEASQADAPDRDAGGGPKKRGSGRIKRRDNCVKSWCGKTRKDRKEKQVCRPTMGKKRGK